MAGEQYIKIAASNIQRAMVEKQNEISQLQTEMDRERHNIESQISKEDRKITMEDVQATRPNANDAEKAIHIKRSHDLRKEIEQQRQEITKVHDDSKHKMSELQREVNELKKIYNMFRF